MPSGSAPAGRPGRTSIPPMVTHVRFEWLGAKKEPAVCLTVCFPLKWSSQKSSQTFLFLGHLNLPLRQKYTVPELEKSRLGTGTQGPGNEKSAGVFSGNYQVHERGHLHMVACLTRKLHFAKLGPSGRREIRQLELAAGDAQSSSNQLTGGLHGKF